MKFHDLGHCRIEASVGDTRRLASGVGATLLVALLFLAGAIAGPSQRPSYEAQLSPTDRDLLRRSGDKGDLPCRMHVSRPVLGFDFLFHVSFEAILSNHDLHAEQDRVRLVARLGSKKNSDLDSTMVRTLPLRHLEPAYETSFRGFILLGEGEYRLEWFLKNTDGRVCSGRTDFKARLSRGDRDIKVRLRPDDGYLVGAEWRNEWRGERHHGSLRLKLLLNVPPFKEPERPLYSADVSRFFHIVEALGRDRRVGQLDIVAFNLKDRRVLFRQEELRGLDFGQFYHSLETLNNSEIDLEGLKEGSDTRFLTRLVQDEVAQAPSGCDAVVFVGPRAALDQQVPDEVLDGVGSDGPPVHYLRFRYTEFGANWKDSISRVVSAGSGREFSILRPRDLWKAIDRVLDEMAPKTESRDDSDGG